MVEKKAKKAEKPSAKEKSKSKNSVVKSKITLPELPEITNANGEYKKKFASANHPYFEAIINGTFILENIEEANQKLEEIKKHFIISAKNPKDEENNNNIIKLWLKNFELSEADEKAGFLGNYALIKISQNKNKFVLIAEKLNTELKFHPQRKRPLRKHPDWGHPCLRLIKKEKIFNNLEDAQKVLQQLNEEFPLVSILANNKLYIILYSKIYQPPIKKFVLEIKADKKGGFLISYKENNYVKKPLVNAKNNAEEQTKTEAQKIEKKGFYTSKVTLDRSKKKPSNNTQFGGFSNRISIPNSDNT